MLLLISDANILIDMEAGQLMTTFFRLPMRFGVPDILYWEEIEPGSPGLEGNGLLVLEVSAEYIEYAYSLPSRYGTGPSSNDYLALALAKQEGCPLLTGDQALKSVANQENVPAMGTIWLLRAMVEEGLLTVDEALAALRRMRENKRRLPWAEAERILGGLG
ncbi:PIN domain-containing protein [Methylomagnum ishizawai]|uniref:PIN domain-containing protein n=1 Tax=Methylomagnum ishizawai TaxID=1760988 RepID=A0A1Y6D1N8_9GAMM|nr:PIN domain-containing protein [Methylomagnum ishizawai]SMF94304.1 PIN domain-containing protein [Methylomagnum ishizawai]